MYLAVRLVTGTDSSRGRQLRLKEEISSCGNGRPRLIVRLYTETDLSEGHRFILPVHTTPSVHGGLVLTDHQQTGTQSIHRAFQQPLHFTYATFNLCTSISDSFISILHSIHIYAAFRSQYNAFLYMIPDPRSGDHQKIITILQSIMKRVQTPPELLPTSSTYPPQVGWQQRSTESHRIVRRIERR